MPDDREREVGHELPVPEPDEVGRVVAVVVAHEHVAHAGPELRRDAVEHLREGRGRVVRDDQDPDSLRLHSRTAA